MGVNASVSPEAGRFEQLSTTYIEDEHTDNTVSKLISNSHSPDLGYSSANHSNSLPLQRIPTEIVPTRPVSLQPTLQELEAMEIKVRDFAYESKLPPVSVVKRKARTQLFGPRPFKRTRPAKDDEEEARWQKLLNLRRLSNQLETRKIEQTDTQLAAVLEKERVLIQHFVDQEGMEEALFQGRLKHHVALLDRINALERRPAEPIFLDNSASSFRHTGLRKDSTSPCSELFSNPPDCSMENFSQSDTTVPSTTLFIDSHEECSQSEPTQYKLLDSSQPPLIPASQSDSEFELNDAIALLTPTSSTDFHVVDSGALFDSQVAHIVSQSQPVFESPNSSQMNSNRSQMLPSSSLHSFHQPNSINLVDSLQSPSSHYVKSSSQISSGSPDSSTSLMRVLARELSRSSTSPTHLLRRSPRKHAKSCSPHRLRSSSSILSPRAAIIGSRQLVASNAQTKKNLKDSPSNKPLGRTSRKMDVAV